MRREKSCGAVVFTRKDGEIFYVLVMQKKGFYGFPKGHMEKGESERQTALREIKEETGLEPRLIRGFRAETVYKLNKKPDTTKKVIFFLGEYQDQEIVYQKEELLGAGLFRYEETADLPIHENLRHILSDAKAVIEAQSGEAPERS